MEIGGTRKEDQDEPSLMCNPYHGFVALYFAKYSHPPTHITQAPNANCPGQGLIPGHPDGKGGAGFVL